MRTLKFIVSGQRIEKDPNCDFSGIVAGTAGYLSCQFDFDKEWSGTVQVAEFRRYETSDPIPVKIVGGCCEAPEKVLTGRNWYLRIVGKNKNLKITTNNIRVDQEAIL